MRKTIVGSLSVFLLSGAASAASFDCAKGRTNIEKVICGDRELSRLDEELERAYKAALSVKEIQLDVRQSQRVWIEKDRNWCDRVVKKPAFVTRCLKDSYRDRILVLTAIATPMEQVLGKYVRKHPACGVGPSPEESICGGEVEDTISVREGSEGIEVEIELSFYNGHECLFEGSANAQNGKLVAKGRLSECVLELYSDGRRIVTHVSDEMDGACRICGARGSLNGAQGEKAE